MDASPLNASTRGGLLARVRQFVPGRDPVKARNLSSMRVRNLLYVKDLNLFYVRARNLSSLGRAPKSPNILSLPK